MKPSEIIDEFKKAKRTPLTYFSAVVVILLMSFGGFIVVKCLDGECDGECDNPVYNYGNGPSCGVEQYLSIASEACGVAEYNSGTAAQCGVAQYKNCETGSGCGWIKLGGKLDIGKVKGKTCRHPNCGVESYKTCQHPDFGVASYKICRDESHGVDSYKSCQSEEFGLKKCGDPPLWQFWNWGKQLTTASTQTAKSAAG